MSDNGIYKPPEANLENEEDGVNRMVFERQPLSPQNILRLFFSPKQYFSASATIDSKISTFFVTYVFGLVNALERIDKNFIKADLGSNIRGIDYFSQSWLNYWMFGLGFGFVSAIFSWYVGGWWYKVRLSWSGVKKPDTEQARHLYVYSSFVFALPALLVSIVQTFAYENYLAAWNADEIYSGVLVLVFAIWSCFISYFGVSSKFKAKGISPKIWFLILPLVIYAIALATIFFIYWKYSN